MIEEDLYSHFSTYSGLTSLVGTRIYPIVAPQNVKAPYCVYSKASNQREYAHDGFCNLARSRMQVSCFADDPLEAKQIAGQVTAAMEAWPAVNAKAQAVLQQNESDGYGDTTGLFHIPLDFIIFYG